MITLRPDLVWLDGRFQADIYVTVDPDTGRIARVERGGRHGPGGETASAGAGSGPGGGEPQGDQQLLPLPGRALIPGFVNAHSHAFQRLIRGRTQWRPASGEGADADFWSWREAMYGAALALSADDVFAVARFCFLEMMRTGITAVGEFHYLHHQPDGKPYPDPNELALRVIAAAEEVGLRIALLNVCYATGRIGQPLGERQRRFRAASLEEYLERTGRLKEMVETAGGVRAPGAGLVTVGVAPHSIRAVPRDWLPALGEWAAAHGSPMHMHVSEQPAEVDACVRAYGHRPVELLAEDGLLDPRFTAVHATHLTDEEVATIGDAGANVCACPTTERDLGDGFLRGRDLLEAGAHISLGTDSHTNLDFLEEMRLVEYHERLRRLRRVVVTGDEDDGRLHVAPTLLRMATIAGARSLRLDAGEIAAGRLADLVAIDLRHHALAGWNEDTLAAMIALSATPDIVSDVWTGGARRLEDRRHPLDRESADAFISVAGG